MTATVSVDALRALVDGGDVVVLSGAGLSTDSGIPDYRGPSGSLRKHAPMQYGAFVNDPVGPAPLLGALVPRLAVDRDARPERRAPGRRRAAAAGRLRGIITQNVDGLHQAGGALDVIELHGGLDRVVCLDCGAP